MKTIVTADLHFSDKIRDNYRHAFVGRLIKMIHQHSADQLLILGDLSEQKDRHGAWLVNQIVGHLHRLTKHCEILVLMGNHDYLDPNTPYFQFLGRVPGATWVNTPTKSKNLPSTTTAGLGPCLYLPHTANYKKDWADVPLNGHNWIFTHNTFTGVDMGGGRKAAGIPLTVFPKGARVISGDIHIPQTIGPVTYVGAPYLVDFGDDYKPRVLLLNNGKIVSLPCHGPQKRLVEIKDLQQLKNPGIGLGAGDILKVRVTLHPDQYAKWTEITNKVRAWGDKYDYQVHSVHPVMLGKSVGVVKSETTTKSDTQILQAYAKSAAIDERTLRVGLELMQRG